MHVHACAGAAIMRAHLQFALHAAADGCVGTYSSVNNCLNSADPSYPCAFANVDLTGTPFSMVGAIG